LLVKNDELRTAYSLGIIIIMGYNYKPMYQAATNVLFYKERTFSILKISFVAGMLNIILNFILVPFFGIYAAAYTTLGCLLFMGFRGFYLKEYRDTKPLEYYPLRWLLTILLTTLVVYLLKDIAMLYKIFITALLGLATLAFTYRNRQILMQN
jgi:O-antigen/teichoic acid export membrane protein